MKCYKGFQLLLLLVFPLFGFAQEEKSLPGKGMLHTQGGFATSSMLKGGTNVYVDGTLGYFFHDRYSFRSDSFFMIPDASDLPVGDMGSLFSGFSYHFTNDSHFDPFLGFQPGAALSGKGALTPLVSGLAGIHYYGPKVFHLIFETRYVHGKQLTAEQNHSLNEFRFVLGLGFNLNILDPTG